jgi:hypothetical protein
MSGEKSKKNRFKRAKEPIVLQPRDELIASLVTEFRFLSREQLQKLLDFPCTTRINIRLKKLHDHGYLSRRLLPALKGGPTVLYFLGSKGIGIISESRGTDPLTLEKERQAISKERDLFLNHQLLLNEVRISLTCALKDDPKTKLERWLRERNCAVEIPSSGEAKIIRPDGYFCFSFGGRLYSFFLEVDCSTMSNGRIKSKIMAYLEYAKSGQYEQDFGLKYFRVLFVTKTQARLLNLKTTIEKLTDKIFYLTTFDLLSRDPIRDRVWVRAGRSRLFSLLEN